jgi:hypothetical protein
MISKGALPNRLWQSLAIVANIMFLIVLATCGGGGGGNGNGGEKTVTFTGVVDDGGDNSPIPNARCGFYDLDGNQYATDTCDANGVYEIKIPLDEQGHIICSPSGLSSLRLYTFVSTMGLEAGTVIEDESITPATTLAADIISHDSPSDPTARKKQVLDDIVLKRDANLVLVAQMAERLYEALLDEQINTDFSGDAGGGDGPGADGGDGIGGEAGDGADFSPLVNAQCSFVNGEDFHLASPFNPSALMDLCSDGQLNRHDLQELDIEMPEGKNPADLEQSFAHVLPDGVGQPLTVRTDADGKYFLPVPANIPGFVRCTPQNLSHMVIGTYVPGRNADTPRLEDQDVTPATTVFSALIATELDEDLATVKENFLSDIEGLETQLVLNPDDTLDSIQRNPAKDPNDSDVGLVAFSAR